MYRKDLRGFKVGKLTALEYIGQSKWKCLCDCGKETIVLTKRLTDSVRPTESCGCLRASRKRLDGLSPEYRRSHKNRLYNQWGGMLYRCTHSAASSFEYYGAANISVCEEWVNSFDAFASWALENGYTENLTIDRIDNSEHYSPSNCRWISHQKNCQNRGIRKGNLTGAVGVTKRTYPNGNCAWRVNIGVDGKNISIGTYHSFQDAFEARKAAELKYWGHTNENNYEK